MTEQRHVELEQLQAYLDQELGADEIRFVDRHLAACPDCEREIDQLRDLYQQIESLSDVRLERDLVPAVLDSVRPRKVPSGVLDLLPWLQAAATMVLLWFLWPTIQGKLLQMNASMSSWSISIWVEQQAEMIRAVSTDFVSRASVWIEGLLGGLEPVAFTWTASSWWLALVVGFAVWLFGNGFLLRNAERRSNRS
jgi:anti-sigma factor RsiW